MKNLLFIYILFILIGCNQNKSIKEIHKTDSVQTVENEHLLIMDLDPIIHEKLDSCIHQLEKLKILKDTLIVQNTNYFSPISVQIYTSKPKLIQFAFINICKSDTSNEDIYIFKRSNTNWVYQQKFKSDCHYLDTVFYYDINFDGKQDFIIKKERGGSRSSADYYCFNMNEIENIKDTIATISSAYDIEIDSKTKTIYTYVDGGNWYQQKIANKWNNGKFQETKSITANFITETNSPNFGKSEVYDPNIKKELYLDDDTMYNYLNHWK